MIYERPTFKRPLFRPVITKKEFENLSGKQTSLIKLMKHPKASDPKCTRIINSLIRFYIIVTSAFGHQYTQSRRKSVDTAYEHIHRLENELITSVL